MPNNTTYKVHVVAGPTASGKTQFAIDMAERLNGELINIDSRQVYKQMDIGTNKGAVLPVGDAEIFGRNYPIHKFTDGPEIHLLSFLNPDEQFNIYDFRSLVYDLIPKIIRRNKTPILVGGSGLYLSAILFPEKYRLQGEKFNPDYRQSLEEKSVGELQSLLIYYSKITYEQLNESDRANKRRLIRKLELLSSEGDIQGALPLELVLDAKISFLDIPLEQLTEKINARVIKMFEQGFVDEVRKLLTAYPDTTPALQGIGYSQVIDFMKDPEHISLTDCIRNVQIAHRQYAKRQITWFKKYLLQERRPEGDDFRLLEFEL